MLIKQKTRILDVVFDNKLTFKKHVNQRIGAANYTLSRLKRFNNISTYLKYTLFQMLSLSQIMFSSTALI